MLESIENRLLSYSTCACQCVTQRLKTIFLSAAIRSDSGGCVLNNPVKIWPALRGATMKSEAVAGGTFIGIRLLYAPSFSSALIKP